MKKLKGILVLVLLMALLASPVAVLASDVTGSKYYGLIQVSNNGTAVTNVATTCNISTVNFINAGYLNSSANNCAIQSSAGTDLPFQPGVTDDPWTWCLWVPAMGADSIKTDILYTANSTGGKIRYFPDAAGMVASDNDTNLELGDNFTIEQSGWWDTTYSVNKTAILKPEAFKTYISGSENITSVIYSTNVSDNISPTTATGASWTDPEKACNGNIADFAFDNVGNGLWTGWLEFAYPPVHSSQIRYYVGASAGGVDVIDLEAYYNDDWHNVYTGAFAYDTWTGKDMGSTQVTDKFRIRMQNNAGVARDARIYEVVIIECPAVVSATGVESGEHTVRTIFDRPFLAISAVETDNLTPVVSDLVFNAPMWQTECDDDPFVTIDTTGYSFALTGATWTSDGYSFDGNDFITMPNTAALYPTSFTWEFWVNPTNFAANRGLFGSSSVNLRPWDANIVTTGELNFRVIQTDDATVNLATTDSAVTAGVFNHIVFTGDGSTLRAYLNAVVSADTAAYDGTLRIVGREATRLGIARDTLDMIGTMGVVRLYGDALTGDEVLRNYNVLSSGDIDLYSANITVPNTSANWTFLQNNVMPYMEYTKIYNPSQILVEVAESANYGGTVYALTSGNDYVYVGGITTQTVKKLQKSDMVEVAESANYGGTVYALTSDDDYVYAGGSTTRTVKKLQKSDLVEVDESANYGGDIYALTSGNGFIYVGGFTTRTVKKLASTGLVAHIEWEYDTVFSDLSGYDNDATPSFRGAPSDPDVTAEFVSFLPVAEAQAPAYVLEEGVDFIESVPVIVSEWDVVPPAGTFPLAGVIVAVSNATETPSQLPLVLIAGFTIIALSLAISSIMRKYGSGTVLVKVIIIAAVMGCFVAIGNFGIDFWMIFVFLVMGVALAMASRQLGWQ